MPLPLGELSTLLNALRDARYGQNAEKLGNLGQVFRESSEANPAYFAVKGKGQASDYVPGINQRHGTNIVEGNGPLWAKDRRGNTIMSMGQVGTAGSTYLANPSGYSQLGQGIKKGQLTRDTKLLNIDSMDAPMGSGDAKKIYPAFWEYMLAHPDAANVVDTGLSFNNIHRRNLNMSGALERWGDRAGDRIRIHNEQISPLGGAEREAEYHAMPTTQKIGLLNAISAPNTAKRVNLRLSELAANQDPETIEKMYKLGILQDNGYGHWIPSTDVEPEYFTQLADLLKSQPGRPQVAGTDSLRRSAITFDNLRSGLTARDLESQPYLTNELARKQGGQIPARKPGALTQMCACAGPKS
jgi:hypothetical protein